MNNIVDNNTLGYEKRGRVDPVIFHVPTQKMAVTPPEDTIPSTLLIAKEIQGQSLLQLLRVLFNSGGTGSMVHERCLPKGAKPSLMGQPKLIRTMMGEDRLKQYAHLLHLILPEFDKNKNIENREALVVDGPCSYDIILGKDILRAAGIKLDFKYNIVSWMGIKLPMKPPDAVGDKMAAVSAA